MCGLFLPARSGPGGATNTVIPALTATKEAAMTEGRAHRADEPEFQAGDRVILTDAPDGYPKQFNIVPGMTGTIDIIDSQRTVHVRWDAGQRFGVIASARHLLRLEGDQQ